MYEIYTVLTGDTIESIAAKQSIDPTLIYQINGFAPNYILQPGTSIVLPTKKNMNYEYYTIKKGDSLYQIASAYGVDAKLLALLNGLNINDYIYPSQVIMVPKKGISFYLVKQGDTLTGIATKLKTNITNLLSQNSNIYLQPEQIIAFRENNI